MPNDKTPLCLSVHLASAVLVGVGLGVRAAYWAFVTPNYVPVSDANQYFELASNLASGRGYSMHFPQLTLHATAFRPPLYPAVLGIVYWLFGPSIVAGRVLNVAIGLAVILLAAALAGAWLEPAPGCWPGCASRSIHR